MNINHYATPYIRSFFEDHVICRKNLSPNTIHSYRDAVKLFILFAVKKLRKKPVNLQVTDFTERLIIEFLTDLEKTRRNSIQTRNHRLIALRCLFEYISLQEPLLLHHCSKLVAIPLKRGMVQHEITYLTKDETKALLDAVDRRNISGCRDYTLLRFMYNTGARVQEVADAKISWLSLQSPYKVDILGKGNKWRTCPLWEKTAEILQEYLEKQSKGSLQTEHLFLNRSGKPIGRSGIAYIIRRYAEKAATNMPSLRRIRITPHTIRHTTAMHLLQSGVEVNVIKSWLGHVSIATTNCYVEIDLEMKAQALKKCELNHLPKSLGRWHSKPGILDWLESL